MFLLLRERLESLGLWRRQWDESHGYQDVHGCLGQFAGEGLLERMAVVHEAYRVTPILNQL